MSNLIYCYDQDYELIAGATETVRLFDVVPAVGNNIYAVGPKHTWEFFEVARCIFNHKGGGTIDLILITVTYGDLYSTLQP